MSPPSILTFTHPSQPPLSLPSACPSQSSTNCLWSRAHRSSPSNVPYPRLPHRILHDKPRPHRPPFLPNIEIRIAHPLLHQELAQCLENPAKQLMGKALEAVLDCDDDAVGVVVEMARDVEVGVGGAVLRYGRG